MCGLTGIVSPSAGTHEAAQLAPSTIRAMTAAIRHRGPDAEGFFEAPGIALGHRRLEVIDLSGGAQPMSNRDETVWVVYNGEIYNHDALRQALIGAGHSFRSHCDTEVLVHGYREWGPAGLLERIDGMFAFAIWDAVERRVVLSRDRMGQKPLYYHVASDGTLVFASEVKALLANPSLAPAVDGAAFAAYLTFEYLPGPLSILDGVHKVLPGTWIDARGGELREHRYWEIPFVDEPAPEDATERFTELFDAAVARRLMADVPLGVFLSGGIDSSSVAASVVRQRTASSVKTFSIGFEEESYDESSMARQVAQHLGTDHHERIFTADAMRDVLPQVVSVLDEPFGDASLLPTYLLSAFAREQVTVALGGDGADELLLGYPTFFAETFAGAFARLPSVARRGLRRIGRGLPVSTKNFSLDFKVNSFLRAADAPAAWRHPLWLGSVIPGGVDDPLHPELRIQHPANDVLAFVAGLYDAPASKAHLQRLSYQYCRSYLAEDILHKVDRASMAASLEARSPFLDRALVEFSARLPPKLKLAGRSDGKAILKTAMRDRLPSEVIDRPKKGFGIPVAAWLKGSLAPMLDELLGEKRTAEAGYLDSRTVRRLIDEHRRDVRNHRKVLWTLLNFELWRDARGVPGRS
ncbi:MAG: asparagine synthase (glutamine-hydrolyzing) [Myxococcota bacterium]